MKTFLVAISLAYAICGVGIVRAQDSASANPQTKADSTQTIKRGEAIGKSQLIKFSDVFKEPQKFAGKKVVIEGVVERVCKMEGCWMQISPTPGAAESVRVTFDHKFTVPKDADKLKFRAEGEFALKILSKEEVDHLVKEDGAKIKTNADGTANEISFLATGVELWKP